MRRFNAFLRSISSTSSKIVLLLMVVCFFSGCYPFLAYIYIVPGPKDINRFYYTQVKQADRCYEFATRSQNKDLFVTNWTHEEPLSKASLTQFLKEHKANHFLVIKNDSIVFEYTDERDMEYTPEPAFSIAKTFTSAALGIAIKEGYIHSVNDLAKDYLPELNYNKNFDILTINHLLNQVSGIETTVANMADAYYAKTENVLKDIHFTSKPGETFEYVNVNAALLGMIVERATHQTLDKYFSEKIWSRIGTCDSTVWAFDKKTNHVRAFCCIGGSARDFAKFGLLYLNKGKWGDQQLIDSSWVNASTSQVNGVGQNVGYNNYWYIGEKEIGDYLAVGMYRQQIYINPKENVVIVSLMKFNKNNLSLRWWELLRQIAAQA